MDFSFGMTEDTTVLLILSTAIVLIVFICKKYKA